MFALTRLIQFPLILGQVSVNFGKPTLNHLKRVTKPSISKFDELCSAHFHKIKRGYSSVLTIENSTGVQEIRVEEKQEEPVVNKGVLGKIEPKMRIMYTCMKCETRNAKTFSRLAYEKGIVIVTCDCCKNKHLIADNLEWFKTNGTNVEKMLAKKGEAVKRGKVEVNEKGEEITVVENSTCSA